MHAAHYLQVHVVAVVIVLGDADIILQRVDRREDAEVCIVIAAVLIEELWDVTLQENLLAFVIQTTSQRQRLG